MALVPPTADVYGTFVGIESPDDAYLTQALQQATDLLAIATQGCLTETPDPSTLEGRVYNYAICSMAEAIIGARPYAKTALIPVRSEVIGSYSYEKLLSSAESGAPTGVSWFDVAVRAFSCPAAGEDSTWSISIFERDYQGIGMQTGSPVVLGPADLIALGWRAEGTV